MSKRILIAGCGRLGTRLGLELAAAGHQVIGLRRNPEALPPGITPCRVDLLDDDLAARLPIGLDQVYAILTPDQYDDEGYRRTFVTGLERLCRALRDTGNHSARLIFVSSTGVYGQDDGRWVDESSPTEPGRFSGQRLLEGEAIAAGHPGGAVIVRFAGIYGPGREALIRRVERGSPCQAEPPRYTNRIHEEDCAGVLAHVGTLAAPAPVYIGVDDAPATQCEIMDWLAAAMGLPTPPRESGTAGGRRCSNRLLQADGYRLRYPDYRSGYRSLLAARRSSV
ncbi:SDR family oxidoreductase [Spiribacter insolitus]|uniref:SDR family oxidoreductase n=1 Tax=Spiribacter insolitus TaxID=3122417 RepID=A0ABV3T6U3_9GAMM